MPSPRTTSQPRRRPGPGRPPGSSREATRARILAAARVCFARSGYASTTNKEIADCSGLTAAAIYQYFDSKQALYLATVSDANEALLAEYRQALAGVTSVRAGLRAFLAASAALHQRDPSLSAFLSALPVEMQRHEEVARAVTAERNQVVRIIEDVVAAGVRAGEVPAGLRDGLVSTFVACALGMSLFAAAIDGTQLTIVVDTFAALIDGTLFAAPRPRRRR
jgi:AcrR family transcriptional regulator